MLRKKRPMCPSAVQQARPIVPPGRQTRTSSRGAACWSGANMWPNVDDDPLDVGAGLLRTPSRRGKPGVGDVGADVQQPHARSDVADPVEQPRAHGGDLRCDRVPVARFPQRPVAFACAISHVADTTPGAARRRPALALDE